MHDLCLANENHLIESVAPRDVQILCLQNQREELQTSAQVLETASTSTLARATEVVQGLSTNEECEDTTLHQLRFASDIQDPRIRQKGQRIMTNLAKIEVMYSLGQVQTLAPLLDDLERNAQSLYIRSALARVYIIRANIASLSQKVSQSEIFSRTALTHAEASHDDLLAAEAALLMIHSTILSENVTSDISEQIEHAEAHIRRSNSPLHLEASILNLLANYNFMLGDEQRKNSALMQQEVVAILERENGSNDFATIDAQIDLGISLARLGNYEAALSNYFYLTDILHSNNDNFMLMHIYYCISVAQFHLDQFSLAKTSIQKAISIGESVFGADDSKSIDYYTWNAELSLLLGQYRKALPLWHRVEKFIGAHIPSPLIGCTA